MESRLDQTGAEALVDRYLVRHAATDLEGVLALFAEDAIVEDPVGSPAHRGLAAIREFYRATHARNGPLVFDRIGRVLLGADEIAFHVRVRLVRDVDGAGMDVIYVLRIDESRLVRSLRAFF